MKTIRLKDRLIGQDHVPFIIAEIGINHEGNFDKAIKMIDDAKNAGGECVKFQSHILEDEMIPNEVIPGNSSETIWEIIRRCSFSEKQEEALKKYTEQSDMHFLSTPFSRAAANRLEKMGVSAYKIGSGECNNYPLIKHIASFGKPVFLSTGMNDISSILKAVSILRHAKIDFCVMHCTSVYPTPPHLIRLNALKILRNEFPDAVLGYSDHSLSNLASLGAIALGASVIERHFTSDKTWLGPDINISMSPSDLKNLIEEGQSMFACIQGDKNILSEEQATIDFAYACVVTIKPIQAGEKFTDKNIWVKRPGTGEFKAEAYQDILGKVAITDIANNTQLESKHIQN